MEDYLKIFNNVGDAVFAVDENQCVVFWNTAAEKLLGIGEQDALGKPCWQLLKGTTPEGRPFCGPDCPILHTIRQEQPVTAFDLLVKGSMPNHILTNISTLFLPTPPGVAAFIHIQRRPEAHSQWPEPF